MKRNWWVIAVVLIILSMVLDFLLLREHGEAAWTYIPGFYALFGLTGAIGIVIVSRLLGRGFLEHNEDYYNTADDE